MKEAGPGGQRLSDVAADVADAYCAAPGERQVMEEEDCEHMCCKDKYFFISQHNVPINSEAMCNTSICLKKVINVIESSCYALLKAAGLFWSCTCVRKLVGFFFFPLIFYFLTI